MGDYGIEPINLRTKYVSVELQGNKEQAIDQAYLERLIADLTLIKHSWTNGQMEAVKNDVGEYES